LPADALRWYTPLRNENVDSLPAQIELVSSLIYGHHAINIYHLLSLVNIE